MVFKKISYNILKKKTFLHKKENKQTGLDNIFKEFLVKEYGENIQNLTNYSLFYEPKDSVVTIQITSKILANDLILKINKLKDILNKDLKIERVIIK